MPDKNIKQNASMATMLNMLNEHDNAYEYEIIQTTHVKKGTWCILNKDTKKTLNPRQGAKRILLLIAMSMQPPENDLATELQFISDVLNCFDEEGE